ncbi:MAG: MmgE/PrpD family protein, partial [Desulfofustis sp.]|nr:MmgE/PrpD family protein [Desulfofustis sp.]
ETISGQVARRCLDITYDRLDDEVIDRTKYLLLDFLGCALRGSLTESFKPASFLAQKHGAGVDTVPVIGTAERSEVSYFALATGIAAHSIELDDVVNHASLHPAVAVIPAALGVCYEQKQSGNKCIEAIVAGYELMVKLGIALDPAAHYARGFHPTGTCGTFGAAVAAGKLLELDADQLQHAIGIAGSQAAGSMEFLADGAYTKRFHAGWSAHGGVVAASLARNGFTGPATIIEGKFGFLRSYSSKFQPEAVLQKWGTPFEILNTSIKPHACCRYNQGSIDCIGALMTEHGLREADIARVTVAVLDAGFALVAEPAEQKQKPLSVVDAQFSMPFGAALAIRYGDAFINRYVEEEIERPEIRSLMKKVSCVRDVELNRNFPVLWPARVTIETADGRTLTKQLTYPKGDPENPLSWEELIAKFKALASAVLPPAQCDEIVKLVREIDRTERIETLMHSLRQAR